MCTNRCHRKTESARGQSLLEFALALPVLLILFLGLIELAMAAATARSAAGSLIFKPPTTLTKTSWS